MVDEWVNTTAAIAGIILFVGVLYSTIDVFLGQQFSIESINLIFFSYICSLRGYARFC